MTDRLEQLKAALRDRYAIERELGSGGMATVYLARDLKHERPVAIKVLRDELATAVGAQRFLREIQIAAGLQHPHILPLYDSGEAGGVLYYVMPYVEGESLRDRLQRETELPIDEVLRIAHEVGSALGYAHGHGIVHRDIKPENIMLSGGIAVVADFGIARALIEAGGEELTKTGLAIGTPVYMSPEQFKADGPIDGRSDLYSLGCVVYEMLAGVPPFTGPNPRVIMARHALDPVPPLQTVRPTVPVSLERTINKTLAKVPADRFTTAEQFVEALTPPEGITPPLTAVAAPAARAKPSFWAELKRRRVYQAAVIYMAVAFGLVEGADLTFDTLGIPERVKDFVVLAALLGFPLTLVFAWAYDFTARGLKRTTPLGIKTAPELTRTGEFRRRLRLGALSVLGLGTFVALYPIAYYRARVPVDITKAEARSAAEAFLTKQGVPAFQFKEAAKFHRNNDRLEFLQRALGLAEAGRRTTPEVDAWHWHFRWFRPGEPEEWRVAVGGARTVVAFEHMMEETAPGAEIEEASARALADSFLQTREWALSGLELVEAQSARRAKRTDHDFTWDKRRSQIAWKQSDPDAGLGVVRVSVKVKGDRIAGYSQRLRVPEAFDREDDQIDTVRNGLGLATFFTLLILAVISVIARQRAGEVRWSQALKIAGLVALLMFFSSLNDTPSTKFDYSTESPWLFFVVGRFMSSFFQAAFLGGFLLLFAAAGESLGRSSYPKSLEAYGEALRGRVLTPAVIGSGLTGLVLGFVLLGYGALQNAVVQRVPSVWSLTEWGHTTNLNTFSPLVSVLLQEAFGAIFAGVLILFAVSVLRRYLKSTAVAVVLPAVVMGFLGPSVNPAYVGGLAAAGGILILSIGFVRFGALACMVALFVSEAVSSGADFIAAGESAFVISGLLLLVCAFLPALPAVIARARGEVAVAAAG